MGDQQQVGLDALDRRVVPLHAARSASADMSPNGSIDTVALARSRRERRLSIPLNPHAAPLVVVEFAESRPARRYARRPPARWRASAVLGVGRRRLARLVVVLAAAHQRGAPPRSGRRRSRTANASCRPARNGAEIRCGKNARPVSAAWLAAESAASTCAPTQVLDRVVAEERGEQDRHRRQRARRGARRRRATPWACRPDVSVCGQRRWPGRRSSA